MTSSVLATSLADLWEAVRILLDIWVCTLALLAALYVAGRVYDWHRRRHAARRDVRQVQRLAERYCREAVR